MTDKFFLFTSQAVYRQWSFVKILPLKVAILFNGCFIYIQEPQRVIIVNPHGLRTIIKKRFVQQVGRRNRLAIFVISDEAAGPKQQLAVGSLMRANVLPSS